MSQFGEPITYYPQGVIASGRTIDAIIERNVEVVNESGLVSYAIMARVLDHAVKGILSTAIDDGRDTISVSFIPDGTAEVRQITRMTSDANGMVRFMVR